MRMGWNVPRMLLSGILVFTLQYAHKALRENDIQRNRCSVIKLQISTAKNEYRKGGTILWKSFTISFKGAPIKERLVFYPFCLSFYGSHSTPRQFVASIFSVSFILKFSITIRGRTLLYRRKWCAFVWQKEFPFPGSALFHVIQLIHICAVNFNASKYKCKHKTCANLNWKWFSKCTENRLRMILHTDNAATNIIRTLNGNGRAWKPKP